MPWTDLGFASGVVLGVLLVIFRDDLLPSRFFYDGLHIQGIAAGTESSYGDKSYEAVAALYRLSGLAHSATLASIVTFLVFVAGAIPSFRRVRESSQSALSGLLLLAPLLLGSVYVGFYSKDVLVVGIVALALWMPRSRWAECVLISLMLLYALFFRQYWLLTALLYLAALVLMPRIKRLRILLIVCMLGLIALALGIYLLLGVNADYFRTSVNAGRIDSEDAQSMIRPFVALPEPFGGIINVILTFFALLVPLPLAAAGGAYYIGLAIVIAAIWIVFLGAVRQLLRTSSDSLPMRAGTVRAIALTMSFLLTQSLFEPDYGSALRHVTPLLLLVVVVVSAATGQRRNSLAGVEGSR
jgi:hypothetical protein